MNRLDKECTREQVSSIRARADAKGIDERALMAETYYQGITPQILGSIEALSEGQAIELLQWMYRKIPGEPQRTCRSCRCTGNCAGGCYWVDPDLCSTCAVSRARERLRAGARGR